MDVSLAATVFGAALFVVIAFMGGCLAGAAWMIDPFELRD